MIDIHSHLLYGVDDGSKTLNESIAILKELYMIGYTDIVLTPHYIPESKYSSCKENNIKGLNILKNELNSQNININLYLGNEIYINDNIIQLIEQNQISSLNDSEYLLIELPLNGEYQNYIDIFKEIIEKGYKIVLAHPERYVIFQKNYDLIYELVNIGVYLQSNIESIIGKYGLHAKKMIKRLLKENQISFLATDIHYQSLSDKKMQKIKRKLKKYISNEKMNELLVENPSKILK